MWTYSFIVLFAVFQVICSQLPSQPPPNLPPQCRGPPQGVTKPHECCEIPPFFKEDDLSECGFQKNNRTEGPPRGGPRDCTKEQCIIKKYNLSKDESTIDLEAVATFMDQWVKDNPAFETAMKQAKDICIKNVSIAIPVCQSHRLMFCMHSTVFDRCPNWEDTDNCKRLKEHIELCRPFFDNSSS